MTFEKHLHSVSRAASERLDILRKSLQVFHELLERCFWHFVLPLLEYCSAVWCSAADIKFKLLDRVVSGTSFLTGGVFECDSAHARSINSIYWGILVILYSTLGTLHPLDELLSLSTLLDKMNRYGHSCNALTHLPINAFPLFSNISVIYMYYSSRLIEEIGLNMSLD